MSENKMCFVIAPIGQDNSNERRRIDGLLKSIRPIMEDYGITVMAAHEMSNPGSISKQIIEYLIDSCVVVADLSDLNPNVLYELAVRHFVNKPVITIAMKGTILPFDIKDERVVFYENDYAGFHSFCKKFKNVVETALHNYTPDNPISRAVGKDVVGRDYKSGFESCLLGKMEKIESLLTKTTHLHTNKPGSKKTKEYMLGVGTSDLNDKEIKIACNSFMEELSRICDIYDGAFSFDIDRQLAAIRVLTNNLPPMSVLQKLAKKHGLKC